MNKLSTRKFLTPNQLKDRFGLSTTTYTEYLNHGLPTVGCAGVIRHPISEVYLWFEENNLDIEEKKNICNAPQLRRLLCIDKRTLEQWEEKGLPKMLDTSKYPYSFKYDARTVISWLRSQQNDMET